MSSKVKSFMDKDQVLKSILNEMQFCLKCIVAETPKDRTVGYAKYFEYTGLTKAAYLCNLISFEDMQTFIDNAYDVYRNLRDKQ